MGNLHKNFTFNPGRHFVRPLPFKAHKVEGFSPETFEQHYENIYGGAVRRLNEIELLLSAQDFLVSEPAEFAKLKSEEVELVNEIILHETYFDSVGEDGGISLSDEDLSAALKASFSGLDNFKMEFRNALSHWKHEAGWIVLVWSETLGRLSVISIANGQGLTAASPLIALDMSDYAHRPDFDSDREAFAEAFLANIHWGRVVDRFNEAKKAHPQLRPQEENEEQISASELQACIEAGNEVPLVLDVRHDDDRERYTSRIMTTDWRDSFEVEQWADKCPKDKPVVVYCMYGFWISQKVAEELRDRGINARSLKGGITSWRAMGFATSSIPS